MSDICICSAGLSAKSDFSMVIAILSFAFWILDVEVCDRCDVPPKKKRHNQPAPKLIPTGTTEPTAIPLQQVSSEARKRGSEES